MDNGGNIRRSNRLLAAASSPLCILPYWHGLYVQLWVGSDLHISDAARAAQFGFRAPTFVLFTQRGEQEPPPPQ